jgi:CHAT domain-containing protein
VRPLSEVLLRPIVKELASSKAVWMIPHDILHNLPLHAMEANGRVLGHSHGVFYSSSASLLAALKKRERFETNANLVVSCPREDDEASLQNLIIDGGRELAEVLGAQLIEYGNATKECIVNLLRNRYDNVVFLCHGFFKPEDPLQSGIELSRGEILSAQDILRLNIQANLVTVAACESGIRQYIEGDEFIGIPQSLLHAGAMNTLTTLWEVAAKSTIYLLIDFFQRVRNGAPKLSALKAAQTETASFYKQVWLWAPFVLYGTEDYAIPESLGAIRMSQ